MEGLSSGKGNVSSLCSAAQTDPLGDGGNGHEAPTGRLLRGTGAFGLAEQN